MKNWNPVIHSVRRVEIPVVVRRYVPEEFNAWRDAQGPWLQSGRTDWSVWGKYAGLGRAGRIRFPKGGQASYGFGEFHTAHWLESAGFRCWRPRLFDYGKPMVQGFAKERTDEVKQLWAETVDSLWPAEVQVTLDFQPRSPDLVGYNKKRNEWRFCEVKRRGDRTSPEQLMALAVLHLLTRQQVAVVRVVPDGRAIEPVPYVVDVKYRRGAKLRWIRD